MELQYNKKDSANGKRDALEQNEKLEETQKGMEEKRLNIEGRRPEGDGRLPRGDIRLFRELRSNMLTRQTGGVTVDQLLLLHHAPSRTSPLTLIAGRIFKIDATSDQ